MDEEGPVGRAVDLYVMGAAMRSLQGRIVRHDDNDSVLWVELGGGALEEGEAVCLQTENSAPWLYGKVLGPDTPGIKIFIDGSHSPDRREFSRVWGPLHLRYQVTTPEAYELAALRWLRHGQGIGPRWQRPPMFMDFSGSGARFEVRGEPDCEADDHLLIGVRIPGEEREYRLTGRVVRLLDNDTQVAIHFMEASDGAVQAMVDFAERIQEQLVELLGEVGEEGGEEP